MLWDFQWNDLTPDEKAKIMQTAETWACPCFDQAGQMALDMFNAVVGVIKDRDQAEVAATMGVK